MKIRKLIILRRISQAVFFAAFVYILWSTTYPLKGMISPQVLFKLDPLIMFVTSLSERLVLAGVLFSLLMIVATLILGRFFCGWICPMGTVIDVFGFFGRKSRKPPAESLSRQIRRPKFFILAAIVLLALLGVQAGWVLDPIVTMARVVSLNLIPSVTLTVDKSFQFIIQKFGLYGGFYDFYRELKAGFLGVNVHFFANSLITLICFLLICGGSWLVTRLWCRMLCPLGALYGLAAQPALLERKVDGCTQCGICARRCRTGAIRDDVSYDKRECILCMDCVYDCPSGSVSFGFQKLGVRERGLQETKDKRGITRRDFLLLLSSVFTLVGFKRSPFPDTRRSTVIRPPGAQNESQLVTQCVRCGNCMKVCITNGLQPTMIESGPSGIWTPKLVPEIGYCEYNCTLCGEVCPTQAIPQLPLAQKRRVKLGTAVVDRDICLAWAYHQQCLVCEEHCPVADKAIKIQTDIDDGRPVSKPVVDTSLCIGCGICQNKCPVRPVRAIRVTPA